VGIAKEYPFIFHVRCVAHSLQLVVNDVLKESVPAAAKAAVQEITNYFRRSGKAVRKLKKIQKENGVAYPLGVLRITPTRWNSMFRGMTRLLQLKNYVITVMSSPDCPRCNAAIKEEEWTAMSLVSQVLKPFSVATDHMQMDNTSLSSVNIEIQKVEEAMSSFARGTDSVLANLAHVAIESSLVNRWEENFNSSIVLAATVLDPWLRKKIGDNSGWRAKAKQFIRKYAAIYLRRFDQGKVYAVWATLRSLTGPVCVEAKKEDPVEMDMQIAAQFEQYMAEAPPFGDPMPSEPAREVRKKMTLTYWYAHLAEAPLLSKFAVSLASITPTSAGAERAFQIESDVFAADRPGLSHENTEAETYIRLNYHAIASTEHARRDVDDLAEIEEDPE